MLPLSWYNFSVFDICSVCTSCVGCSKGRWPRAEQQADLRAGGWQWGGSLHPLGQRGAAPCAEPGPGGQGAVPAAGHSCWRRWGNQNISSAELMWETSHSGQKISVFVVVWNFSGWRLGSCVEWRSRRGELGLPDVKGHLVSGNQDLIPMSNCLLLVVLTTDLGRWIFALQ